MLTLCHSSATVAGWRRALVAGTVVAMAAFGGWVPVSASAQAPPPLTETFRYVGPVAQSIVVPAGVGVAEVRVVGGEGGGAHAYMYITGGDGAQVSGNISVTPGQSLTLKVAGYGGTADGDRSPGAGGWGATGYGGRGGGSSSGDGGGGGGASSIEIDGQTIVIAGGGGGAGGVGFNRVVNIGGPGGSSGTTVDPGHKGGGPGAGQGGSGAGNGVPPGGGGGNGSNLGGAGGGGGAGFTGGAGGAGGGTGGGGGGGGGAGSSDFTSRLAAGSVVRGTTDDGNGLIAITWALGVVGMASTPSNAGYWEATTDGGVFAFGDAAYEGSLPGDGVSVSDIVGIVPSPSGHGYLLVGSDGGVFSFGDATYDGGANDG
jgi:hypothetical protein